MFQLNCERGEGIAKWILYDAPPHWSLKISDSHPKLGFTHCIKNCSFIIVKRGHKQTT